MRHIVLNTLALAGIACGVLAFTLPDATAQQDARKEARLLTLDGDFSGADALLAAAPEDVRNDAKFRMQLGDMALKWVKRQEGTAKVPGLIAAKAHFAVVTDLAEPDPDAALAAVETGLELVSVQVEAKQPTVALQHADWSVKVGEAALAKGNDTADLKLAVAAVRAERAKLSHKIEDFDRIVGDYDRSAELRVACAEKARKPAEALGSAARVYLELAAFIAEGRPIKEEKRDEEALLKALDTSLLACETKGADEDEYTVHLLALIAIHRAKKEGAEFEREDLGKPYMQELGGREGVKGLDLFLPKADGWKKLDKSGEWDMVLERQVEGDTSAVQFMIKGYPFSEKFGGKGYDQLEYIANARFEGETKDTFKDVSSSTKPEQRDMGKKGPEIWYYAIAGTLGTRRVRVNEWMMLRSKKEARTWRIRIIDWRITPDLEEPDIVEFVNLALGLNAGEDDKKGKKGKKK